MFEVALALPRSIAAFGTDAFREALEEEFPVVAGALDLQDFTERGGWPDEDTIEVDSILVTTIPNGAVVEINFSFDEAVATGCADIQRNESICGSVEVHFDIVRKRAFVLVDSD